MREEPTIMACWECIYKHLRDTEHHLEDMVRVRPEIRETLENMIDTVRGMRKLAWDMWHKEHGGKSNPHNPTDYAKLAQSLEHGVGCSGIITPEEHPTNLHITNPDNPEIPEYCRFEEEKVKPKEYFHPESFRTLCPECPESRCAECPPELACATRIIIGCKKEEWDERTKRCKIGTETHVIYHGVPKP